jgi:hypothetical protein
MRLVFTMVAMVALSACGSMNQSKKPTQPVTEQSAVAESAKLPAVTLVKVPVDASGNEIHDKAEMRLANSADLSEGNVEAVFGSSSAPETFVDELDQSSSTESFHGWRRHCHFNCGRGYTYSNTSYTSYNWSFYRPTYYYYGYYYNWNYAQTYRCRGYNYYRYNSTFSQSYSGYGNAPGYGYPY